MQCWCEPIHGTPRGMLCGPTTSIRARLSLIRHLLAQLHYKQKDRVLLAYDPAIVFTFDDERLRDGSMAQ
jgi:hypothetical protein